MAPQTITLYTNSVAEHTDVSAQEVCCCDASNRKKTFFRLREKTAKSLNIILNSVRQHNHFITQGNYKATCFDYRLDILMPILSVVSHDSVHTLGSTCLRQWNT